MGVHLNQNRDKQDRNTSNVLKRILFWIYMVLASPAILLMFLGEILAAPFVKRRHESNGRWLMFMAATMAPPVAIIVVCLGIIIRKIMTK